MTGTLVKNVSMPTRYTSAGQKSNKADQLTENFASAFSKASMQQPDITGSKAISGTQKGKDSRADRANQTDNTRQTDHAGSDREDQIQDNSSTPVKESSAADNVQKVKDAEGTEQAGEELVEEVAEELGISVEEVQKAMEMLGLTAADLLIPDNMTQLVLQLEGTDLLSLVTDEGLYQSMQNLLQLVSEKSAGLAKQLGMTQQELTAALQQMQDMQVTGSTEAAIPEAEEMIQKPVGNPEDVKPDERKAVIMTGKEEVQTENVQETGQAEEDSSVTVTKVKPPEEAERHSEDAGTEKHQDKGNGTKETATQNTLTSDTFLNVRDSSAKTEAIVENTMTQARAAETKNIMNQIMDYMKVQVKADLTQMQIQLHPADLGTVNINIASKEGVITAQFVTQNESVKAAIESQVLQLKSNLEEQGLKVEAVEVTVATHEFERNLSGEGQRQDSAEDRKKKGSRRINLHALGAEEALDEEQQLTAKMMTADGNTIDFTA